MAREARLWQWLKEGLAHNRNLHMRRVENLASVGDPDVDGCCEGVYFEIELKGCNRPARSGILDFEIRKSQIIWHRRRLRAGGNTWIYIRVGMGAEVCRYLIPGSLAGWLKAGVTEADLARESLLSPGHSAAELLNRVLQGQPPNLDPTGK